VSRHDQAGQQQRQQDSRARALPFSLAAVAAGSGLLGTGLDLDGPASVAQALGVLAAIVAIHEAGHFSAARALGVRVTQFAIGFGPALLSRTGGDGVEYSLRAIPLGGYVAFPDDDEDSGIDPADPDLLKNRPLVERAVVISAGVAANLVSAAVILLIQASTVGVADLDLLPGVSVPRVLAGSPASAAGVRPGDVITAINGRAIGVDPDAVRASVAAIQASAGVPLTLDIERTVRSGGGSAGLATAPALTDSGAAAAASSSSSSTTAAVTTESLRLTVTPTSDDDGPPSTSSTTRGGGGGRIGVQLATHAAARRVVAHDVPTALSLASREYARLGGAVLNGLAALVTNFGEASRSVSGPVAIVAAGAEVARSDAGGLFSFFGVVSLNLAIVNLLPLPALDGGYLALLALEAARRGEKLPDGVEKGIMASGLLLLMATGAVLVVRDAIHLSGLGG
jgi:membrane-associated protease RseP (regulator of RpoE activity)